MGMVWRLKNFEYAGCTLPKIWSGLLIDGYPIVAEFIEDETPVILGTKSEEWKRVTFDNRNISYKLWNVPIQNVARTFNHHTWKLFHKNFYHPLYQLSTRVTELNRQNMTKMLPTYPCIRIFSWKMPWCLLKLQRNSPREYHMVIHVHLSICSKDECALIVAYIFRLLKENHVTGLVAKSLKVGLKTQQSVCDRCDLLSFDKRNCYGRCVSRDGVGLNGWSWCRRFWSLEYYWWWKWKWIWYSSILVWWNWRLIVLTLLIVYSIS